MGTQTRSINIVFGAVPLDFFVTGVTFPGPDNAGLPSGSVLTDYNGDLNLVAGQHLVLLNILGFVTSSSKDSSLTFCRVRGRAPGGTFRDALVTGLATETGFKLFRCLVAPDDVAQVYYMNGIGGKNVYSQRCELHSCVDSWHAGGDNIWDDGSWAHDMAFYMFNGTKLGGPGTTGGDHATDSRWPGATHNDHFQGLTGKNHRFRGTRMDGTISRTAGNAASCYNDTTKGFGDSFGVENAGKWGACITVTPKGGTVTGEASQCWLDGTEVQFQMPFQGGTNPASGNDWIYSGNRHGMPHPYASGTRYEHARMTAGMGVITAPLQNVYGDFTSVTTFPWTATTSPAPAPGNAMPGTITPLSLTTRR